ncbi:uncharacterized protein LOC122393257 [Amphibalanus amphitrite]|uniref:uncharacterized protein LOC122393257 n=1 Tax=Amphibalanus amphitrite TaxID=1232801 RepID=UPI001C91688D|nr:uncharacterized protein LOC122393257 [Amphibalanus amphitrite]
MAYSRMRKYPCVTRYGNFPVSHNSQKFFRCRGDIVTLEDCGNSYIFDPDVRYCVLRKKAKETSKKEKKKQTNETQKRDEKSSPQNETSSQQVCPNGFSSMLMLQEDSADKDITEACRKNKQCKPKLDKLRERQCRPFKSFQTPLKFIKASNINMLNVSISNSFSREARFWWVSDIPSELHWRSPGYVVTLQDCLMLCHDRFVIVGTATCACGSIREENADFNVYDWVRDQNSKRLQEKEGFLLHDRETFKTVGWSCGTKPTGWNKLPGNTLSHCVLACVKTRASHLAFGRDGCHCSVSNRTSSITALPVESCHHPTVGLNAFAVLDVGYWTKAIQILLKGYG